MGHRGGGGNPEKTSPAHRKFPHLFSAEKNPPDKTSSSWPENPRSQLLEGDIDGIPHKIKGPKNERSRGLIKEEGEWHLENRGGGVILGGEWFREKTCCPAKLEPHGTKSYHWGLSRDTCWESRALEQREKSTLKVKVAGYC